MDALSFQHLAAELRLYCGSESLVALARELKRGGCRRAVVVCGRSVSRSDAMELLHEALGPVLVGELTAVRPNSPAPAVEEAARALGELQADAVIAIGGGSAAVTARAASILKAEMRPLAELCTSRLPNGEFNSPRLSTAKLPQFVVPTTPSTAFVKAGSAVHDPSTGRRLALFDPKTRARAVFLHPAFLQTAPSELVQSASLNTLSNAIEALETPACDPVSEAMLIHTLRLITKYLDRTGADDIAARERLAVAAVLCGRGTEQAGGGLSSVLTHAIGHHTSVANGIVNAIVLPHTMLFNVSATGQTAQRIADGLHAVTHGVTGHIDALQTVLAKLSIPRRLRDIGVTEGELRTIGNEAMSDWFIKRNPRHIEDAADVFGVLSKAW